MSEFRKDMHIFRKEALNRVYSLVQIPFVISNTRGEVVMAVPDGSGRYFNAMYWMNYRNTKLYGRPKKRVHLMEVGKEVYVALVKLDNKHYFVTVPVRSPGGGQHPYYPLFLQSIEAGMQNEFFHFLLQIPAVSAKYIAEYALLCKYIWCGETTEDVFLRRLGETTEVRLDETSLTEETAAGAAAFRTEKPDPGVAATETGMLRHEAGVYSRYTETVCGLIRQQLFEPIDVEELCKHAGVCRRTLSAYFKRDTGMGIAEYITNRRLEEAAYLLRSSDMTISMISELLLFSTQSHFTERFRKRYGVTPLRYRLSGVSDV